MVSRKLLRRSSGSTKLVETELAQLVQAWRIGSVLSLVHLDSGANNDNWAVESSTGSYVLRIYRNADAATRIPFEHELLKALSAASLPFAVPVPLSTAAGGTIAETSLGPASLAVRIMGRHPDLANLSDCRAAGTALGELDRALAPIPGTRRPGAATGYGDLSRVHPAVAGPEDAIELLDRMGGAVTLYERVVKATEQRWPQLMASLSTQLIHSDYARSNVLVQGDRVSGVLDFEFSGPGLRAMDFAVGILYFGFGQRIAGVPQGAVSARAFVNGFCQRLELSPQELAALPDLLLRRLLVVGLHWLGRAKVGISTEDQAMKRFANLFAVQNWLDTDGNEVLA
jgi:homoserine kinase type II